MNTLAPLLSLAVVFGASSAFSCSNGMNVERRPSRDTLVAAAANAYRDGRFAEAAYTAEKALAAAGTDVDKRRALRTLGLANLKLGNFGFAASTLEKLVKDNKEPFVQSKLAEAQLREGEAQGVIAEAGKATLEKLAGDGLLADADAWTALAKARARAGDTSGAMAACLKALEVQPGHAEAQLLLPTLGAPAPVKVSPEASKSKS